MKSTTLMGIVLLMLGVLALVVPIPRRESRGVKIDNTKIGIQTETRELPPALGLLLACIGACALPFRNSRGARRLKTRSIHVYWNLLPVPVKLLRYVRIVVNIHGDLLSFSKAEKRAGKLAVVCRH
jgi:hypothetical protein